MRFGVREICDVVFKPLTSVDIAGQHFDAGQPVLYLDTAKTSSLEGTATTVYAQGGKGNPRLIGWDGEKVITFTVEDALMSPVSFAMLSGAGVIKGSNSEPVYVHTTYDLVVEKDAAGKYYADLTWAERNGANLVVSKEAPIYPVILDNAGAQKSFLSAITKDEIQVGSGTTFTDATFKAKMSDENADTKLTGGIVVAKSDNGTIRFMLGQKDYTVTNNPDKKGESNIETLVPGLEAGATVRIDCYTVHGSSAYEMEIEAGTLAGYYYIEASTLFRDEATGVDMPAEFVIPRGKIQSNFTFTMSASGDPSTFTFTIDAFPAYTKFNKKKKVMAVLQVIEPQSNTHNYPDTTVIGHSNRDSDDDVEVWYPHSLFGENDAAAKSE